MISNISRNAARRQGPLWVLLVIFPMNLEHLVSTLIYTHLINIGFFRCLVTRIFLLSQDVIQAPRGTA